MTIGVPKEIKIGETRVSMTPSLCRRCVSLGAKVLIQKSAGLTAGFTDDEYRAAGATLVGAAAKVWRAADLILKVKEPLPAEYGLLQDGQTIFTYLHLAAGPELAKVLLKKKILGIAYETVEGADGQFPLLKPMSQIAGRLSIQIGAYFLQSQHGGSGVLLGGIPGTMPGHVVVVGAGNSGAHAVQMAAGMGARVTVLDLDTRKLEALDTEYRGRIVTLMSNPANIDAEVADADLLIGAVLIPAAKAPDRGVEQDGREDAPGQRDRRHRDRSGRLHRKCAFHFARETSLRKTWCDPLRGAEYARAGRSHVDSWPHPGDRAIRRDARAKGHRARAGRAPWLAARRKYRRRQDRISGGGQGARLFEVSQARSALRVWLPRWLLIGVNMGVLAPALAAKDTWLRVSAPEFTLITSLPQRDAVAWAGEFSQYVAAMRSFFKNGNRELAPLTVVIFSRERDFEKYRPLGVVSISFSK